IGRVHRERWPNSLLEETASWENRGASVEGYLQRLKLMGPESCNCRSEERRDYHLWLGSSPDTDRTGSIVCEVSPRTMPHHASWRLRILGRLAQDKARVRISGWLMWDPDHPAELGKTRGTLWEIHPVHRIEVYSGGRWKDLDGE